MNKIKFCENNFTHGIEDVIKKLKKESNIDIDILPCLGLCDQCEEGPFALVNGELILTKSKEELYEKIKELL